MVEHSHLVLVEPDFALDASCVIYGIYNKAEKVLTVRYREGNTSTTWVWDKMGQTQARRILHVLVRGTGEKKNG